MMENIAQAVITVPWSRHPEIAGSIVVKLPDGSSLDIVIDPWTDRDDGEVNAIADQIVALHNHFVAGYNAELEMQAQMRALE